MKILVAGATGFIGKNLVSALLKVGHDISVLGRDVLKINKVFPQKVYSIAWANLNQLKPETFDLVINLAGETIAQLRWTPYIKNVILNSRIDTTKRLVEWLAQAHEHPPHLYQASAVSIYGLFSEENLNSEVFTENSTISNKRSEHFLTQVAYEWEKNAAVYLEKNPNAKLTILRFGVVLQKGEGILKQLKIPFQLGLGTVLGSGQQKMPWIHIDDVIAGLFFLMEHPEITGPINFCAPEIVQQKEFAQKLAGVLHRPQFLKMPSWVIHSLMGQMGDELLLKGQNIYPERLIELGYSFKTPNLKMAFLKEFGE